MYCTRCGNLMDDNARYCPACGKPVGADEPAPGYLGPTRRLHRIRSQKKIAGVCAGFAEYFDMDVTVMRLIWVAMLLLPPSPGLIGYIIAWIAMPKD